LNLLQYIFIFIDYREVTLLSVSAKLFHVMSLLLGGTSFIIHEGPWDCGVIAHTSTHLYNAELSNERGQIVTFSSKKV